MLKWIGSYKQKLQVAQAALTAVKVGADGALQLLTEVIAASDKEHADGHRCNADHFDGQ